MNEDTIADFKQFIAATVHQEFSGLKEDMDARFDQVDKRFDQVDKRFEQVETRLDDMDEKLDEILNTVGQDMDAESKANATKFDNHEQRIARLEKRAA